MYIYYGVAQSIQGLSLRVNLRDVDWTLGSRTVQTLAPLLSNYIPCPLVLMVIQHAKSTL